jgi:hypothetical protein
MDQNWRASTNKAAQVICELPRWAFSSNDAILLNFRFERWLRTL